MKKVTVKIKSSFVDWILSDYSHDDLIEMLGGEETKEDVALSVAGMFPNEYIENYKEIEPFIDKANKGKDFIHGIQDGWEVEFVQEDTMPTLKTFTCEINLQFKEYTLVSHTKKEYIKDVKKLFLDDYGIKLEDDEISNIRIIKEEKV
tara:strand:- start:337 stop:780 length:444 start_codon:yes stop_codon:yes gene_type:complete